jgi:hypothetical protein
VSGREEGSCRDDRMNKSKGWNVNKEGDKYIKRIMEIKKKSSP